MVKMIFRMDMIKHDNLVNHNNQSSKLNLWQLKI